MKPETEHILTVLKTAMRVLGFRNRDLERKLGASPGYLSRVFSGDITLRHDLIVDLARAMELDPGEIFRAAYPPPPGPSTPAAEQIRQAVASFGPSATAAVPPPAPTPAQPSAPPAPLPGMTNEDMEALMSRALRRFFKELSENEKPR